jgi:carboxyl-terminal processing protease
MKKRFLYGLLVTVLLLNLAVGAQIYLKAAPASEKDNVYPNVELFMRVIERVRQDYVDGEKLSYQDLVYAALKGMVGTLDPHSEFMEPVKYTERRSDTEGAFGGVGLLITLKDNILTVISPTEDSPAFKAGVLAGDKVVKIDGVSTEKMGVPDAAQKLRGEPGTDVTITVARPNSPQVKEFKLTRAVIKVDTVKDINGHREFPIGEHKTGYIRLTQFTEQSSSDLQQALKKLDAQGMQGLILDLRNNPGGLLDQAIKVCELFLPHGQLIVSTEGRSPRMKTEEYKAQGHDLYPKLQIVILVNGGSASAAEIVSGCLQDLGRAFIMGEQTFGKGSVQSILPLPDGSALVLTTAKYYTPSHKVIHEKGITPDSIIPMSLEEEEALMLKRVPGGFETLDEPLREKARTARDIQLERATDFLRAMNLYRERVDIPGKPAGKMAAR